MFYSARTGLNKEGRDMETRFWCYAAIVIMGWFGFLGWLLLQLQETLTETGVIPWSMENVILLGLGAIILVVASVPVIAVLQPLIALAGLVAEGVWQLLRGIYLAARWLIRRHTHA
ncbi:hypothetical protein DS513_24325 [Salmonella enterica subsp. enterica serovar Sandiego]|uniref:Uncharacterized protein n=2 Tax=Salmonella enterica TaxID=28901 RepID=A0A5U0QM99_SALER|nr:hypothetical protein [Salmonella enterica]EBS0894673.1 hypothetical protein [Salmonella enterica subsp. enterica serovar Abaetetuba]EBV0539222.1 hypothetical protein [Salmonella enterica subsp. enterica serovar Glostrup]EBX7334611.1 hypothetical protein [Salmonella enterica subsp. enterica serovar Sandiego]ECA7253541.1 hypothetical protein [Salmonella enterica subsp. enterica serovar Oranienburg]EEA9137913.1 hypothetical protein [Salmonella enterica subsp. enterica]